MREIRVPLAAVPVARRNQVVRTDRVVELHVRLLVALIFIQRGDFFVDGFLVGDELADLADVRIAWDEQPAGAVLAHVQAVEGEGVLGHLMEWFTNRVDVEVVSYEDLDYRREKVFFVNVMSSSSSTSTIIDVQYLIL